VVGEDGDRGGVDGREGVALDRDGSWTDAELRRAEELVETKYRDEGWVRTRPGNGDA
jgi:lipoate-protein ligase A